MREPLEMGARLAQAAADALDLADPEPPADQRVEVDAAGDDVAARLGGRRGRARRRPRPRSASGRGRRSTGSRTCPRRRRSGRPRGRGRRGRSASSTSSIGASAAGATASASIGRGRARRTARAHRVEVVARDRVAALDVVEAPAQRRPGEAAGRRAVGDGGAPSRIRSPATGRARRTRAGRRPGRARGRASASHTRQPVHGSGWSAAGAGISSVSSSRIAARMAARTVERVEVVGGAACAPPGLYARVIRQVVVACA